MHGVTGVTVATLYLIVGGLVFLLGIVILREAPREKANRATALMLFFGGLGSVLGAIGFIVEGAGQGPRTGSTDQQEPKHRPDCRHKGQRDHKTRRKGTDQIVGHDPRERETAHSQHDGHAAGSNQRADALAHDFAPPPGHVRQLVGKPAPEWPIGCQRALGMSG